MNIVHGISLVVAVCMGVFHLILSVVIFKELTPRVVWYIGVDVGTVAILALNFIATRTSGSGDRLPWKITHAVNSLCVVYTLFNYYVIRDYGNVFAILVYIGIFIGGILSDREGMKRGEAQIQDQAQNEAQSKAQQGYLT